MGDVDTSVHSRSAVMLINRWHPVCFDDRKDSVLLKKRTDR